MSLFVLDTSGDNDLLKRQTLNVSTTLQRTQLIENINNAFGEVVNRSEEDSEDDGDYFGLPPPNVDISRLIGSTLAQTQQPKQKAEEEMDHVSELVNAAVERAQTQTHKKRNLLIDLDYSDINARTGKVDDELLQTDVNKEMATCVLPGVEMLNKLPMRNEKQLKKLNKATRAQTKGANWYNLPATEITDEVKNDLKILQMRSVLDPKRFYKKNDLKVLPKYFQVGTVLHSPLDHFSERNVRRNKKSSLVEELLNDEQFQKYNKRKYNELMARREKYKRRKAAMKMKKLKKKK